MKKTRLLSLILALLTALVTLAGCTGKEDSDEKDDAGTMTAAVETNKRHIVSNIVFIMLYMFLFYDTMAYESYGF